MNTKLLKKEQELTFENINSFFLLCEEMVAIVSNNIGEIESDQIENQLNIIEKFIEEVIEYSEIILTDYTEIIKDEKDKKALSEDISIRIAGIIEALQDCREQLLGKLNG